MRMRRRMGGRSDRMFQAESKAIKSKYGKWHVAFYADIERIAPVLYHPEGIEMYVEIHLIDRAECRIYLMLDDMATEDARLKWDIMKDILLKKGAQETQYGGGDRPTVIYDCKDVHKLGDVLDRFGIDITRLSHLTWCRNAIPTINRRA